MWRKFLLFFLILMISGCSDNSDKAGTSKQNAASTAQTSSTSQLNKYSVLDSYEVGKDVYVRSTFVDEEERALWVGTSIGVHEIDLDSFGVRRTFTREDGLANEYVFAIGKDSQDSIWFGTNAGGVSSLKGDKWKTYFPMHGLADYWVYSFASHPDGSLWIGTWAGVNRLDLDSDKMETYVKELINEWVYAIEIDSKQRIWFGTEGGISLYDGKTWKEWEHKDGLGAPNTAQLPASTNTGLGTRNRHDLGILNSGSQTYNPNYVFSLELDHDDSLWAGTWGGGVSHFDGKKWQSYSTREGLPGNVVYSLARDKYGVLWAGTNNGLALFRNGSWTVFSENQTMQGLNIYTLAATSDGEIWAGTNGKIFRIGTVKK
ncbi:MAG: regulator [Magnetococcales bacterium]|nr:regulator [Magnetococcales bacterium]